MHPTVTTPAKEQSRKEQPPSSGILQVTDLWKAFVSRTGERLEVLRGVSLSVSAGEIVAITGASGAGKSTLLHLLGRLEAPDRGTIQLNENAAAEAFESIGARPSQARLEVGFIFQFHHLLSDLTAFENVALPLSISRSSRTSVTVGQRFVFRRWP